MQRSRSRFKRQWPSVCRRTTKSNSCSRAQGRVAVRTIKTALSNSSRFSRSSTCSRSSESVQIPAATPRCCMDGEAAVLAAAMESSCSAKPNKGSRSHDSNVGKQSHLAEELWCPTGRAQSWMSVFMRALQQLTRGFVVRLQQLPVRIVVFYRMLAVTRRVIMPGYTDRTFLDVPSLLPSSPTHVPYPQDSSAAMASEQTYIMVKPDGVQRGIYIEVLKRFQQKGFTLKAMKMVNVTKEHAENHYADLSSKPFFPALVEYMTSGPVIAMVRIPVHVLNQALAVLECLCNQSGHGEWTRPHLIAWERHRSGRARTWCLRVASSSAPRTPPSPSLELSVATSASSWAATSSTALTPLRAPSTRSTSGSPRVRLCLLLVRSGRCGVASWHLLHLGVAFSPLFCLLLLSSRIAIRSASAVKFRRHAAYPASRCPWQALCLFPVLAHWLHCVHPFGESGHQVCVSLSWGAFAVPGSQARWPNSVALLISGAHRSHSCSVGQL